MMMKKFCGMINIVVVKYLQSGFQEVVDLQV